MRRIFKTSLITLCVLSTFRMNAAAPEITARMTPDSIAIGDHFTLDVTVTKDIMQVVEFLVFKDNKFGDAIEILQESGADTVSTDGRQVTIAKKYLMTAFDAGIYEIGGFPMLYLDKNIADTLFSRDTLRLLVTTFQIDTAKNTIYDIKRPELAPRLVSEVSGYFITGLVGLCTLAAAIAVILGAIARRRRNRAAQPEKQGPKVLPHVRAIHELETLHNQKVWQNNRHKHYYSRLSDILRIYIDGRYGVQAMEMTTDEIMSAMQRGLPANNHSELKEILRTADLVKFAKLIPDGECNEDLYYKAYYFVEDTKDVPEEEAAKDKPAKEEEDE